MVKIADIIDVGILDREMALALFVLRGSVDFTRNYMAVDVKRNVENELYIDSLFKILVSSNELIKYLNLNFRELQPEFKSKKRNTQLRLNLRWVYENILNEIGSIHPYKYDIISSNKVKIGDLPQTDTMYTTFIQRLIYYQRNVLKKELSNIEVENIRHELFSVSKNDQKIQRSKKILLVVKDTTKDICSACSQKYKIADRSFIASREKRYYFEYHHVISFANNRELLDVPDNLVKLCPTCHCAMKKGRAECNYQKKLIKNILNNRKDVLDFSKSYLNTQSLKDTVDGIQKKLR
jgi:HNH endonuclease.